MVPTGLGVIPIPELFEDICPKGFFTHFFLCEDKEFCPMEDKQDLL